MTAPSAAYGDAASSYDHAAHPLSAPGDSTASAAALTTEAPSTATTATTSTQGAPARLTPPKDDASSGYAPATGFTGAAEQTDSGIGSSAPAITAASGYADTAGTANPGGTDSLTPSADYAPLGGPTQFEAPSAEFDPPTIGLPRDRETAAPTDPAPPTATDAAGITVTGTFRAFDIERAHVDKLQAMLDELKRSAGLPPGRRDVFGPPTPEAG